MGAKAALFLFVFVACLSLIVHPADAPAPASACDYVAYGDSQCEVSGGYYCIDGSCTAYSGSTAIYCRDSDDGAARNISGYVSYLYRSSSGAFVQGMEYDWCNGNSVVEYTCNVSGSVPYLSRAYNCMYGCSFGQCRLDTGEPILDGAITGASGQPSSGNSTSSVVGKACDYALYGDLQCRPQSNIFCLSGACTTLPMAPEQYCIDSDGGNFSTRGEVSFSYRKSDGGVSIGTISDTCIEGGKSVQSCGKDCKLKEYACYDELPESGKTYAYVLVDCASSCSKGTCELAPEQGGAPSGGKITDGMLLEYVSKWAKGELAETEGENDAAILMVIEEWKNG